MLFIAKDLVPLQKKKKARRKIKIVSRKVFLISVRRKFLSDTSRQECSFRSLNFLFSCSISRKTTFLCGFTFYVIILTSHFSKRLRLFSWIWILHFESNGFCRTFMKYFSCSLWCTTLSDLIYFQYREYSGVLSEEIFLLLKMMWYAVYFFEDNCERNILLIKNYFKLLFQYLIQKRDVS